MIELPGSLTIVDGCFALDGGSVGLRGYDDLGRPVTIGLDWSLEAQRTNSTSLNWCGLSVPKRSEEETALLQLLESADYECGDCDEEAQSGDDWPIPDSEGLSCGRFIGSSDIQVVMDGIDNGPVEALRAMVGTVVAKVRSVSYQTGREIKSLSVLFEEARIACRRGDYARTVQMLEGLEGFLTPATEKYLALARQRLVDQGDPESG